MNNPQVSVIIPVYNTEAYVEQAVRSIMEQTLRQIEIIAVDDGSTDGSGAILERLAAEDRRIRIHKQPNKGLSGARNAGLDLAHGRYVYFMDSDDLLESDALACCYELAEHNRLDFVFFDADTFGVENPPSWLNYTRVKYVEPRVNAGGCVLKQMLDHDCYKASACLSFIRLDFLQKEQLRFRVGILHEDELFTPQLYLAAKSTFGINRALFHRRLREGSIMTSRFSTRNVIGYTTVMHELTHYAAHRSREDRHTVRRLIAQLMQGLMRNAWVLPLNQRLGIATTALFRYPYALHIKPLCILFLKNWLKR